MKKLLISCLSTIITMTLSAQTVQHMNDLKPEQKSGAINLKLTGDMSKLKEKGVNHHTD